jgi:uncharacterized membrane protein
MMGFAGWFGAGFFLGFIGAAFAFVMRDAAGATLAALVCSAGAWGIFRLAPRNDAFAQFGLALGLAGQGMWGVAIFHHFTEHEVAGYLALAGVEAVLIVLLPNFLHRIFATVAAVTCLALGLAQAGIFGLTLPLTACACAAIWRNELSLAACGELWSAVGYGLALGVVELASTSLLVGELQYFLRGHGDGWMQHYGREVGSTLVAGLILWLCLDLLKRLAVPLASRSGLAVLGVTVAVVALIFPVPGLGAALLLVLLGFGGGNRVLLGLGLLSLATFLSHYYYRMDQTLLVKAQLLAATGAVFLLGRLLLRRLIPMGQGGADA